MSAHQNQSDFICRQCDIGGFVDKNDLNAHTDISHKKIFSCSICKIRQGFMIYLDISNEKVSLESVIHCLVLERGFGIKSKPGKTRKKLGTSLIQEYF